MNFLEKIERQKAFLRLDSLLLGAKYSDLDVTRTEYMKIPILEVFQVELCMDAMLFADRFENLRKERSNKISETYLKIRGAYQCFKKLGTIRSEIKATKV